MITKEEISPKQRLFIRYILFFTMPLIGMVVDVISPALPIMAYHLHTSQSFIQNLVSIYLLGYAIGNLGSGLLTDSMGRKILMRIGMVLFGLSSLMPLIFPEPGMIMFARLMQGISMGTAAVVVRASFSDLYPPEQLVKIGIALGALWGLGPVIGPVIGGYLVHAFSWKAIYVFTLIYSSIILLLAFVFIPETLVIRQPLNLIQVGKRIMRLFHSPRYLVLTALMGLVYAGVIVFNTLAPFYFINTLHRSAIQFGHIAQYLGMVFVLSTFLVRLCLKSMDYITLLKRVISGSFVLITFFIYLIFHTQSSIFLILASGVMYFTCGVIFPTAMGAGMSLFRDIAGLATAIMYFVELVMTSVIGFLISFILEPSSHEMIMIYFVLVFLMSLSILFLKFKEKKA